MINWSEIDSVFLDLDGTLLDLHFDNHFWLEHVPQRYAEKHAIDPAESKKILDEKYRAAMGTLDWYCTDYWSKKLDLDIPSLKIEVKHKISIRPDVEKFLQFLQKNNKRIVLVTNAHLDSVGIKMNKTNLQIYFDRIISAHDLAYAKEQNEFWMALEKTEHFDPQRTIFIDDNFDVLDAAARYGITNLLAIKKPDSQGEEKQHPEYHLLDRFTQIM